MGKDLKYQEEDSSHFGAEEDQERSSCLDLGSACSAKTYPVCKAGTERVVSKH